MRGAGEEGGVENGDDKGAGVAGGDLEGVKKVDVECAMGVREDSEKILGTCLWLTGDERAMPD